MNRSAILETEFEEALQKTLAKHPKLDRQTALAFIKTLADLNQHCRRRGESSYYLHNLALTLRQFGLEGKDAKACRSLAGYFFGRRGLVTRNKKRNSNGKKRNCAKAQIRLDPQSGQYTWTFSD